MFKKIIFLFVFSVSSSLYLRPADESDLLVPANFNIEVVEQDEQMPNQYQEVMDLSGDIDDSDIDNFFIDIEPIPDIPMPPEPTKPSVIESCKLVCLIALMKASEISTAVYVTGLGLVVVLSGGGFVVYKKYKNKK